MSSQRSRIRLSVSWSSWIGRNDVLEQLATCKAAGSVEMSQPVEGLVGSEGCNLAIYFLL